MYTNARIRGSGTRSRRAQCTEIARRAGTAGLAGLAGCTGVSGGSGERESGSGGSAGGESETVKATWFYNSEVSDLGRSWTHNEGRKTAAETFDWLETEYSEAVAAADTE